MIFAIANDGIMDIIVWSILNKAVKAIIQNNFSNGVTMFIPVVKVMDFTAISMKNGNNHHNMM